MSSTTTQVPPPIDPNTDPYASLGFTRNPHDGSISRTTISTTSSGPFRPSDPVPGLSKDLPINPQTNTWARIYLPPPAAAPAAKPKLPLIVYFHGGGFVACTAATSIFHAFCSDAAAAVPALVVSVDYRLAPEHRLPAAYDDSFEALQWVAAGGGGDDWLADYADFSNCFLMGSSAGGNIAYHVGLRAAVDLDLPVMKIRGLILHQPFFGGAERTDSEVRAVGDKMFPPGVAEAMWELSLPVGADREHEYCNPMRAVGWGGVEKMRDGGWRVLVAGCEGDLFVDRQIEFVRMLREKGVCVVDEFSEGGFHGVEHFDEARAEIFYGVVKNFVNCD